MRVNYIQLRTASNYLLPDFYQKTRLLGGGVMGGHQLSSSEELETNKPTFPWMATSFSAVPTLCLSFYKDT